MVVRISSFYLFITPKYQGWHHQLTLDGWLKMMAGEDE